MRNMKPFNTILIFTVVAIITITIISYVRNSRQNPQTQPIPITEDIDKTEAVKQTPVPEDFQTALAHKNNFPKETEKIETPGHSSEVPLVGSANTLEKTEQTPVEPEKPTPVNVAENINEPSQYAAQDNREKSSRRIFLGDNSFIPEPDWIKKEARSIRFEQFTTDDESLCFTIEDPLRSMKWYKFFEQQIDPDMYSHLVFEYTAERLKADDAQYTLWLFDLRDDYGGFTAIPSSEIVSDGKKHTMQISLDRFDIEEFIHQIAIQVSSNEQGNSTLTIHKLEFLLKEQVEE